MSGCASYSLANLFDDDRFLEGVPELTVGEGTYHLNKKLAKYEYDLTIGTVFCTQTSFKNTSNRLMDESIFELNWYTLSEEQLENWLLPMLVSIKRTAERNHCILVLLNLKTRNLHVFDSLQEDVLITTPYLFLKSHHIIEVDMFFKGDEQDHIFILRDKHYFKL